MAKKSRCPKGSRRVGSRCVSSKGKKQQIGSKKLKKTPKTVKKYKKTTSNKSPKIKIDTRGCSRQSSPKYMKRNSPPYPANQCCGSVKIGNDGNQYISKSMSGAGHCRWVKLK
jgi:hypothetical protein